MIAPVAHSRGKPEQTGAVAIVRERYKIRKRISGQGTIRGEGYGISVRIHGVHDQIEHLISLHRNRVNFGNHRGPVEVHDFNDHLCSRRQRHTRAVPIVGNSECDGVLTGILMPRDPEKFGRVRIEGGTLGQSFGSVCHR